MTRIELDDTTIDAVMKLSEGNHGAATVCIQLMENTSTIDPQAVFGPLAHLLNLDTYEIYGSRIWMLYKDVCSQNISKTIALLRATQLGILSPTFLNHGIDNYGEGIDIDNTILEVQKRITLNIQE